MADVLPQLLARIEAIEKHLNLDPANTLNASSLDNAAPGVDASAAPATKLDVANATGTTVNPDVQPSTSQPGAPSDVPADTGLSASKKSK